MFWPIKVIKSCTTNTKIYYFRQLSAPMHFTICTNQFSEPWNMIGMGIHHTEDFVHSYFILFVKAKWCLDGRTVTDWLSCSAFKAQCSDIRFLRESWCNPVFDKLLFVWFAFVLSNMFCRKCNLGYVPWQQLL